MGRVSQLLVDRNYISSSVVKMHKSLALVSYSGSSSEDDDDVNLTKGEKRKLPEDRDDSPSVGCTETQKKKVRLPVPEDIKCLFDVEKKPVEDSSQHGGRIRSFPHEEGNWATLVCIPYERDERFEALQHSLFMCLRPLEFQPMTDYHISLSRTVTIRHHWIPMLVDSLKDCFSHLESCVCEIQGVKLYTNDEKTRSFLALVVGTGSDILEQYVGTVDTCFREYNLQPYYKPPSFHLSIGWCLGDVTADIGDNCNTCLQMEFAKFFEENAEMKFIEVDTVHCKTGNKLFTFPLTDT